MPTKNERAKTKSDETEVSTGGAKSTEATVEAKAAEPVAESEEMVQVSKADLATFVKRLEELEDTNKKLLAASDKGRMHQINEKERANQKLLPTVKVSRIGGPLGKIVLAWNLTNNQSYVDGNRLVELQEMEVFYVDGTSETMPLISFYRQQNKDTIGKIIARTRDEENGSEMLKLELPDGDILEIELKFVN
jgi:hypothetical protein